MFVIAGVSGNTGSVVAEKLLAAGKQVRVVVRDAKKGEPWKARGAEVAVAELNDRQALARALAGAEGAYLIAPPNMVDDDPIASQKTLIDAVAGAVADARVPHVVWLSSIGAQHADGNGPIKVHNYAEKKLAATGVPFTAVRAAYFVENWGSVVGAVKNDGVLPSMIDLDHAIPMVSTRDIGATAAKALLDGPRGPRRVIELGGPRDATPREVAAIFGKLAGRDVNAIRVPDEQIVPILTSFGIKEALATELRELDRGVDSGRVAWESPASAIHGTEPLEESLKHLLG